MDIILEAVKKSSEPLETDLNKKKNLTFSYKKPNLKTIASSAVEQAQSNPGQLKILQLPYIREYFITSDNFAPSLKFEFNHPSLPPYPQFYL